MKCIVLRQIITQTLDIVKITIEKNNLLSQLFQFFWLQEAAYIKIHAEIADVLAKHARPVHEELYEDWSKFLDAFLSQGE